MVPPTQPHLVFMLERIPLLVNLFLQSIATPGTKPVEPDGDAPYSPTAEEIAKDSGMSYARLSVSHHVESVIATGEASIAAIPHHIKLPALRPFPRVRVPRHRSNRRRRLRASELAQQPRTTRGLS
jgi:hypothetical protein